MAGVPAAEPGEQILNPDINVLVLLPATAGKGLFRDERVLSRSTLAREIDGEKRSSVRARSVRVIFFREDEVLSPPACFILIDRIPEDLLHLLQHRAPLRAFDQRPHLCFGLFNAHAGGNGAEQALPPSRVDLHALEPAPDREQEFDRLYQFIGRIVPEGTHDAGVAV